MSAKVSVIVPVYNVGQYLEKCLNSLVSQTLRDIEIIVVNDGSTDNSQDIIDVFAEKYPTKITALRQENQGLGPARNIGVSRAGAEYIGFVDSDDWVSEDMFELLYETIVAENSDCAVCDSYRADEIDGTGFDCKVFRAYPDDIETPCTVASFVKVSTFRPSVWNKLYKRRLILRFPFWDKWYEDLATIPALLSECTGISYLPKSLYYYRNRPGSIMDQDTKIHVFTEALERCLKDCNPKYRAEMIYALYSNLYRSIILRRDLMDSLFIFLWKYEELFKANEYIQDEISSGAIGDLFALADSAGSANVAVTQYVSNLTEFLDDTEPLVLQLDKLPQATLSELCRMYGTALQSATGNSDEAGPKLLVKLSSRYERILEKMKMADNESAVT